MASENLYPTGPIQHSLEYLSHLERFKREKRSRFEELTGREIEILTLVAGGMNNPAIARELGISRVTVQNHRSMIREKLDIDRPVEFIRYALAFDLVQF